MESWDGILYMVDLKWEGIWACWKVRPEVQDSCTTGSMIVVLAHVPSLLVTSYYTWRHCNGFLRGAFHIIQGRCQTICREPLESMRRSLQDMRLPICCNACKIACREQQIYAGLRYAYRRSGHRIEYLELKTFHCNASLDVLVAAGWYQEGEQRHQAKPTL